MRQKESIMKTIKAYVDGNRKDSPNAEISFWKKQGIRIENLIQLGSFTEDDFIVISQALDKLRKSSFENCDYTNVDENFLSMCKNYIKLSWKFKQKFDEYLKYFDPDSSYYKRTQALCLFRFFNGNKSELYKVFEPLCKLLFEVVNEHPENIPQAYSIYQEYIDVLFTGVYITAPSQASFFKDNFNESFSNLLKVEEFQIDGYLNTDTSRFKVEGCPIYTIEYWNIYEDILIQEEKEWIEFQSALKAEWEAEQDARREFEAIARAEWEAEQDAKKSTLEKEEAEFQKQAYKEEKQQFEELEEISNDEEELNKGYEELLEGEKKLVKEYKELTKAYEELLDEYKKLKNKKDETNNSKIDYQTKYIARCNELDQAKNFIDNLLIEREVLEKNYRETLNIIDKNKEILKEKGTDIPKILLDELDVSERRNYYRIGVVGGSPNANKDFLKGTKKHKSIYGINVEQLELAGDFNEQHKDTFEKTIRERLELGKKDFVIFLQSDHETTLINELEEMFPTQVTIIGRDANGISEITKAFDGQRFHWWKFEERFLIALKKYERKSNNDNSD